ncbi:hypothetical protein XHV734_5064 [Xanthomonas hortorum pv. vitians]|nr:hypothetical protein XHV734_5064 [Xanthomonas hortorum pv. vitians]
MLRRLGGMGYPRVAALASLPDGLTG